MFYRGHHLISAGDLDRSDLIKIFRKTAGVRRATEDWRTRRTLRSKLLNQDGSPCVVRLLFYEPSSRTANSFREAIVSMGGDARTDMFVKYTSSVAKGEGIADTMMLNGLYNTGGFVIRHDGSEPDALKRAADAVEAYGYKAFVINAGEGNKEHPTQMVIDLFTVWDHFGELMESGRLTYAFVGDIQDSRTIHSDIMALEQFGGTIFGVSFADNNVPQGFNGSVPVHKVESWQEIADQVDVWYFTRLQKERKGDTHEVSPEREAEYVRRFGVNNAFLERIRPGAIIMHPLPRGAEIPWEYPALRDPRIVINEQVRNGYLSRMVLLEMLFNAQTSS